MDEEYKNAVVNTFIAQAVGFYSERFKKLVQPYVNSLEVNSNFDVCRELNVLF